MNMAEEDESQNATIQHENMATERTDKLDKCLTAIREDLASWLSRLLHVEVHVETFLEALDTGVALGRLANFVQTTGEEFLLNNPGQSQELPLPKHGVTYRERGAFQGSFIARDNVANLIRWCRELGVPEVLMFETEDLVTHRNEKSVLLALLEVARKAYRFGVDPPELVRIENEIDREIEQEPEESEVEVQKVVEYHLKKKHKSHSLDDLVYKVLEQCTCPVKYPVLRLSEGKYRVGENKNLIFVRVMRNHVMVRVGGGWDTLERYFDKHDPCRAPCDKTKGRQRRGSCKPLRSRTSSQCDGFTRSPSSMSTCSVSSGDSGCSSTVSQSRMSSSSAPTGEAFDQTTKTNRTSRRSTSPSPRMQQMTQRQATSSPKVQRRKSSVTRGPPRTAQTAPRGPTMRKSRSMHDLSSGAAPLERVEITCYRPGASWAGKPKQGTTDKYPKSAPGTPSRTRRMSANLAAVTSKVDSRRQSTPRVGKPTAVEVGETRRRSTVGPQQRPSSATVSRSSSFGARSRTPLPGGKPQRSRTVIEPSRHTDTRRASEASQRSRSTVSQTRTLAPTAERRSSRAVSTSPQRRGLKSSAHLESQRNATRRRQTAGSRSDSPCKPLRSARQAIQPSTPPVSRKTTRKNSPTRKLSNGLGSSAKHASQHTVLAVEEVKPSGREVKSSHKDSRSGINNGAKKRGDHDATKNTKVDNDVLISSLDQSLVDGIAPGEGSNLFAKQKNKNDIISSALLYEKSKTDFNPNIKQSDQQIMTNEGLPNGRHSPCNVVTPSERSGSCSPSMRHCEVYSESGSELTETDSALSGMRSPQPSLNSSYSDTSFALMPSASCKLLESKDSAISPVPPAAAENETSFTVSLKERLQNLNLQGSALSTAARGRIFEPVKLHDKENRMELENQSSQPRAHNNEEESKRPSQDSVNDYGFLYQGPSLSIAGSNADNKTEPGGKSGWSFVRSLVSSIESTYKPGESQKSPRKKRTTKSDCEQSSKAVKDCKENEATDKNIEENETFVSPRATFGLQEEKLQETNRSEETNDNTVSVPESVSYQKLSDDRRKDTHESLGDTAADFPEHIVNHISNNNHKMSREETEQSLDSDKYFGIKEHEDPAEQRLPDSDPSNSKDQQRRKRNSRDMSDYFPKPQRQMSIEDLLQEVLPNEQDVNGNGDPHSPTGNRYQALI